MATRGCVGSTRAAALAFIAGCALCACEGVLLGGPAGPTGSGRPGETPGEPAAGRDGGGDSSPPIDACAGGEVVPTAAPLRRLSTVEYLRTLADLFPGVTVEQPPLPPDTTVDGFENDARSLGPSDLLVARWEDIAFRHAEAVTSTPTRLAAFLPCARDGLAASEARACAGQLLDTFGRRAWRRPLTASERDDLLAFFETQRQEIDLPAAVELTLISLLISPSFVYRLESPRTTAGEALDPYELASRLSYFLWQSPPDDALLDAAGSGGLGNDTGVEAQVARMLEDPKARAAMVDFHRQWLDFDRILRAEHESRTTASITPWTPALRAAIHDEQARFVERTIFDGAGTLRALLTSRDAEVNASLGALYGVGGPADDAAWIAVQLPEGERSGILTRAGFLASHAHAGNGSPPLRGVFVRERLLCEPHAAPPAGANLAPPMVESGAPARTNRDLFAERTAAPQCQGCHVRIDPVGFGFENYDAFGAFRDSEEGLPVDASGSLFGTDSPDPFADAVGLSQRLAESAQVHACATSQWMRFALGAAPGSGEACLRQRLVNGFAATGGDVRALVHAIATAPEWRLRATPID